MAMHSPPHPGRIVKSAIEELGLSIANAALALDVSRMQLNRVVRGDSAITADMAVRLEAVIGSTAATWLQLQAAFDLACINNCKTNPAEGLRRIQLPA